MQLVIIVSLVAAILLLNGVKANCGCLKCSQHLRVVSPPNARCKIIYRDTYGTTTQPRCGPPLSFSIQAPVVPPSHHCYSGRSYNYRVEVAPSHHFTQEHHYEYPIQIQAPIIRHAVPCTFLADLVTRPDRIVIPAPQCHKVDHNDNHACPSIWHHYGSVIPTVSSCRPSHPILEPLPPSICEECGDRYSDKMAATHAHTRKKRHLPIITNSVNFIMDLLPRFIKGPIERLTKIRKYYSNEPSSSSSREFLVDTRKRKYWPEPEQAYQIYEQEPYQHPSRGLVYRLVPKSVVKEPELYWATAPKMASRFSQHDVSKLKPKLRNSLLQKLRKLNNDEDDGNEEEYDDVTAKRRKRSLNLDTGELVLPFFRVTDIETNGHSQENGDVANHDDIVEMEMADEDEIEMAPVLKEPQQQQNGGLLETPLLNLINTPIKMLQHFGHQLFPVVKSVPNAFVTSRKYLRNIRRDFKNGLLDIASNIIGDFDDFSGGSPMSRPNRYRFKRHTNVTGKALDSVLPMVGRKTKKKSYEPEYSLVFPKIHQKSVEPTMKNKRTKRYILKVVDEDEVEQYVRDKLGGNFAAEKSPKLRPKQSSDANSANGGAPKKKFVVEKLSPKIVLDQNGRPFVDINGMKRPLFPRRPMQQTHSAGAVAKSGVPTKKWRPIKDNSLEAEDDMKMKISNLIEKAREKYENSDSSSGGAENGGAGLEILNQSHGEISWKIIKDRINYVLDEIQGLINLDFGKYEEIHAKLCKLENFKIFITDNWKTALMESKIDDLGSKIRILDYFRELQELKEQIVKDIAKILADGTSFINKKLIKILVRLQKLQCLIAKIVDDFEHKLNSNTKIDVEKEIRFIDFLEQLHFVVGQSRDDLEQDLRLERDLAVENQMKLLEKLRNLSENVAESPELVYEQSRILWEIKNLEKLQKDTVEMMNNKIENGQKIRKELKILFDLMKQLENCEEKQQKLLKLEEKQHRKRSDYIREPSAMSVANRKRDWAQQSASSNTYDRLQSAPNRMYSGVIVEHKKPVKIISFNSARFPPLPPVDPERKGK